MVRTLPALTAIYFQRVHAVGSIGKKFADILGCFRKEKVEQVAIHFVNTEPKFYNDLLNVLTPEDFPALKLIDFHSQRNQSTLDSKILSSLKKPAFAQWQGSGKAVLEIGKEERPGDD
mmetsp:Transcript_20796/g.23516  ORF Transcript_20796/g.23516 Transcript_20796/m.23516 type:complete len:118 (-) Transcript_20796:219-572(-)